MLPVNNYVQFFLRLNEGKTRWSWQYYRSSVTMGIMFKTVYRRLAVPSACTNGKTPTSDNSEYENKYLGDQRPQNLKYATAIKKGGVRDLSECSSMEQEGTIRWQHLYDCGKQHAQATRKVITTTPFSKSIQHGEYSRLTSNPSADVTLGCKPETWTSHLRALLGPLKVLHYGQSPTQNFCNFPPDKSSTPICTNCTFNIGPKTSSCHSQDSNIIKYSRSKGSEVCLPTRMCLLIL